MTQSKGKIRWVGLTGSEALLQEGLELGGEAHQGVPLLAWKEAMPVLGTAGRGPQELSVAPADSQPEKGDPVLQLKDRILPAPGERGRVLRL